MRIERLAYNLLRWVEGPEAEVEKVALRSDNRRIEDRDGCTVFLFENEWALDWIEKNHPSLKFSKIK